MLDFFPPPPPPRGPPKTGRARAPHKIPPRTLLVGLRL